MVQYAAILQPCSEDKVKLEDILSPEKIKLIKQKMKLYKGEDSLTEIKNYIGGTVSYEELRWYREKQSKI
ncbi:MAG: helix-turn-helix domain-containing protein [Saprospiraceae bacterium]|nr:helix-turn-helix domain-containing protein [Saprospiraceae bacterium]